jgi:hypothetical protein
MTDPYAGSIRAGENPFSRRGVLVLVVFGAAVFVAMLWMLGAGMSLGGGSTNDGGGHAGGRGLNGFAAMADYLERRGMTVRRSTTEGTLDQPALLILTPPVQVDPGELEELAARRRMIGPTMVVMPKWISLPAPAQGGGRKGWVRLAGPAQVNWPGFRDDLSLTVGQGARHWHAEGLSGLLPAPDVIQSGSGARLIPLVVAEENRVLAGYIDDGGIYPSLERIALGFPSDEVGEERTHPLILVFEPDLLNNYGFADRASALLAERLVRAAAGPGGTAVNFDLTLNGHARSANLLTLAFTPPFLAATLCLLIAGLIAGWRAFLRFGPAAQETRAIAFGKQALVANTAGLIRRTRRLHLVAAPYATAVRERLCHALAVPRGLDPQASEAAIDRAMATRGLDMTPFSVVAERLRGSKRLPDIIRNAMDLHGLERTLSR